MSISPRYSKTVLHGRDHEALRILLDLHAPPSPLILDATCNQGAMWRGSAHRPAVRMDADASFRPDVAGDFTAMPFRAETFDAIVYDPPHLPTHAASPNGSRIFERRYGITARGRGRENDNVTGMFAPFLREAARVLRPDGVVLAKIADIVHNHRQQWQHVEFIRETEIVDGLTACDLLIKVDPSAGSLMSSKWRQPCHLRKSHCYWIVVRKGRCERRGPARPRVERAGAVRSDERVHPATESVGPRVQRSCAVLLGSVEAVEEART